MHPEAHAGFGWALASTRIDPRAPWRVLDIGGQDVNGTAHDHLPAATVTTLDLERADIIADATTWQPDRLFDVVIATEVFEHVPDWPAVVATMHAALDPDGPGVLVTTCASTDRRPHGATGARWPAEGEHYANVDPVDLADILGRSFRVCGVRYQFPPGDAYAWALT